MNKWKQTVAGVCCRISDSNSIDTPICAIWEIGWDPKIVSLFISSISWGFLSWDILKIADGLWLETNPRYCQFGGASESGQLK